MADNENGSEKTEQPTAKRLSEARNQGNIPKSTDLNNALGLLTGMLLLIVFGSDIHDRLLRFLQRCYGTMGHVQVSIEWFLSEIPNWLSLMAALVVPFLLTLALLTIVLTLMQVGPMFTFEPMKPDIVKILNPIPGLLRLVKKETWVRALMSLGKVLVVASVAWSVLDPKLDALVALGAHPRTTIFSFVVDLMIELGIKMALAMLLLSIIDFFYQKNKHNEDLKMTKEEVKEEAKQMEGDPKTRQRRRKIQMQMARERMMKSVQEADVVVVNPVELAVALKYDPEKDAAPKVVAKGARLMAKRIKDLAREAGVVIYEHKSMARALYEAVEVNEEIPDDLYSGVAMILSYVWQMNDDRSRSFADA
jgi:flagellar biosynthetic protein FlhB